VEERRPRGVSFLAPAWEALTASCSADLKREKVIPLGGAKKSYQQGYMRGKKESRQICSRTPDGGQGNTFDRGGGWKTTWARLSKST